MPLTTRFQRSAQNVKKKPPPRPPPPNFNKYKSKSTFNLNNQSVNLIEFNSPPGSPKSDQNHHHFGGSISSSFSSSTSSLASSKKSFELDTPGWPLSTNPWPVQNQSNPNTFATKGSSTFQSYILPSPSTSDKTSPSFIGPTIIRAQSTKKPVKPTNVHSSELTKSPPSPPMPTIPPPSPPKDIDEDVEPPYGIALYDFEATQSNDLPLQVNDIVLLIRRVNNDWLFGRVLDREGIFPENYLDIKVPMKEEENIVRALYEFQPQMSGDLMLKPGQKVRVTRKVSDEWLYGKTDFGEGQFPANFVDRVPKSFR